MLHRLPHRHNGSGIRRGGFTLIEILVTMSIILILAGIVISVQRGVYRKQSEAKAKGELQAIATALETFKLKYGDYPWLGPDTEKGVNATDLFDVLTGAKVMTSSTTDTTTTVSIDDATNPKPAILEASKLTLDDKNNPTKFVDPWGNAYLYYYVNAGSSTQKDNWNYQGFILLSLGPDGKLGTDPGFGSGKMPTNADTYYGQSDNTRDNIIYGLEF